MIDIETVGLERGSAIVEIGAVQFEPVAMIGETFHASVSLTSCQEAGLTIDADTVEWWLGDQPEIATEILVGADDLADDLRSLEEQARDAGHTDEKCRWAWTGMTEAEQRAERAEGRDMTLCSACGGDYPTATDGGRNGSQAGDGDE